eukprot:1153229-Pelagomonas_calceolata.AAC.5
MSCSGRKLAPSGPQTTRPTGCETSSRSPGMTPPLATSPRPFPETQMAGKERPRVGGQCASGQQ